MKIGIITIPPSNNYGGAMQAYALVKVLRDMGHEASLVMPHRKAKFFKLKPINAPFVYLKRAYRKYILAERGVLIFLEKELSKRYHAVYKHYNEFLNNNIEQYHCENYSAIPSDMFDAFVVGSDQVWRAKFHCNNIEQNYLDFAKDWSVKRYAYAASFGVSTIEEYSEPQLQRCAELAKLFDAISMREDSGVDICREHFGVEAVHLLDPTMLFDKCHYEELIKDEPKQEGKLMAYILDKREDKNTVVERCCQRFELSLISVAPKRVYYPDMLCDDIQECVIPSPYRWLADFRDAEFVVTDSFHGVVFSFIFNKPFVVIMNRWRGTARIESLLRIFGLEDRIIEDSSQLGEAHFAPIDYARINAVKKEWQQRSMEFLRNIK